MTISIRTVKYGLNSDDRRSSGFIDWDFFIQLSSWFGLTFVVRSFTVSSFSFLLGIPISLHYHSVGRNWRKCCQ